VSTPSTEISMEAVSPMDGLEDLPVHRFTGIPHLKRLVDSQSDKLQKGDSHQQYLVVRGITEETLAKLDCLGKHVRVGHNMDTGLLIMKLMPGVDHEETHLLFSHQFMDKLRPMGVSFADIIPVGAGRFYGRRSSKEGDSAFKPRSRRLIKDWPTIVFESGLSESLAKLRSDAKWWLIESRGQVKIVVLFSVKPARREIRIEKWCLQPPIGQRLSLRRNVTLVPTKMQGLVVTENPIALPNPAATLPTSAATLPNPAAPLPTPAATIPNPAAPIPNPNGASYTVTGGPLVLEFAKILLRAPVAPQGNLVFTAADLSTWAETFWDTVKEEEEDG